MRKLILRMLTSIEGFIADPRAREHPRAGLHCTKRTSSPSSRRRKNGRASDEFRARAWSISPTTKGDEP
jgi:hypothetical protein